LKRGISAAAVNQISGSAQAMATFQLLSELDIFYL